MRSKENIVVDYKFTADGETFFMCNLKCATPKTTLSNVKNCTLEMCNLYGCEVDESNTLVRSNVVDTTPKEPEPTVEEQLETEKVRVLQLEKFITDNALSVPSKEVI